MNIVPVETDDNEENGAHKSLHGVAANTEPAEFRWCYEHKSWLDDCPE